MEENLLYNENIERVQSRMDVIYNLFKRTGQVMFPENKSVYRHLSEWLDGHNILEVGCGIGLGSAMLSLGNKVTGTDKNPENVQLAKCLYPWLDFHVCDISTASPTGFEVTVCVDVIEHIKDYKRAIKNLVESASEVWISTPNRNNLGMGQNRPHNSFHVKEFTPSEMVDMIGDKNIDIYTWDKFERVGTDSTSELLVYKIHE